MDLQKCIFDQMRARLQIETPCNLSLILHTLAMMVLNKARYLHNNRDRLMSPIFLFCRSDPRRFGLLKRDKNDETSGDLIGNRISLYAYISLLENP